MGLSRGNHELHTWVAATLAVMGSLGWLHDSIARVYGSDARLTAHQEDMQQELAQQRSDVRTLVFQLANCRGKHEE